MRVAVIGAGAAGLCSGHHLKRQKIDFVIFESSDRIGGTWVYDERTIDEMGEPIHSSCYRDLRSNLPGLVMAYPRFPFKSGLEGFLDRSEVLEYLEDFCTKNELREKIRFGHKVIKVVPQDNERWLISIRVSKNREIYEETFDAVLVCAGRFSVPRIPHIEGLREHFKGPISHSHDYRVREAFSGQTVLVIGASLSGLDIALELSTVCPKVFLSARYGCQSRLPENIELVEEIERVESDSAFVSGSQSIREVDAVMFCTGYKMEYPFVSDLLHDTDGVTVEPLFKHLIHIEYPTLCFVGLPYKIIAFIAFDYQVQYFISALLNIIQLPSKEEMYDDLEAEKKLRSSLGQAARHFHVFDRGLSWEYFDWFLENTPGLQPYGTKVQEDYMKTIEAIAEDAGNFRDTLKFS